MSKITDVIIPEPILEQLRCSLCQGYLSCAPVQVLPSGASICGRCVISTTEGPTYRQITLELVLSNVLFPCQLKKYGCEELLPFGQTNVHETTCDYRPMPCPSLPPGNCTWEESAIQIPKHIVEKHQDLIVDHVEFILQQFEDKEEVLLAVVEGVSFAVKYMYNAVTSTLCYHVQYFPKHGQGASYKIRVTNNGCSNTLEDSKCAPYNTNFYDMQNSKILFMDDFITALNSRSYITVYIDLTVHYNDKGSTSSEYLTPSASKDCSWPDKLAMSQFYATKVTDLAYPCRWSKCTFLGQADNIREHEMVCQHCVYECPFSGPCSGATFLFSQAVEHLEQHCGQYFVGPLIYKTWLANCYGNQNFFTLTYGRVVLFCHLNTKRSNRQNQHEAVFKVSNVEGLPKVIAKLRFEHSHCRVKSRIFILNPHTRLQVDIGDLPRCFRPEQQLTVTLTIEKE